MKFDRDEIENYRYGSPLWAGLHDRILIPGVNDQEFWSDFLLGKGGKGFAKRLDCPENRGTLILKYRQLFPAEPVVRTKLNELLWKMMISGNQDLIDPNEEPEDLRPRDSQGRVMSSNAIQWRDWTAWVTNPETSMRQVNDLRRNNPGFAEFYAHYAQQERTSTPIGDSVQNLNVKQAPAKKAVVPADVQQFAAEYRTMSSAQVKTLLSSGLNPLGSAAAAKANQLFNDACALGLI
jgi:hypothetical protein